MCIRTTEQDDYIPDYTEIALEELRYRYSKKREIGHVSDIVNCPRQRVFKELNPTNVTMRELNYFTRGKAMHEALQGLFLSNPRRFKKEFPADYEDAEATIDLFDNRIKVAIEFKTHDTDEIQEPHKFHLDQLKYYMAILDLDKGALVYQLLRHKGERPLKQFNVYMKKWERLAQLARLSAEMESIKNAVDKKDPSLARGIYDDSELNWMCWTCPFKTECEGMR